MEFLHSDWLQQILSWQKPSGCWGLETADVQSKSKRRSADSSEQNRSTLGQYVNVQLPDHSASWQKDSSLIKGLPAPNHHSRKLLYEVTLSG
jgi:Domain of unknown function (DUF4735)